MKRDLAWRAGLVGAAALLSFLYILPSIPGLSPLPGWWRYVRPLILAPAPEPISLGLDLQGGTHLILEVETDKAVENATDRLLEEVRRLLDKQGIGVSRLVREGPSGMVLVLEKPEERDRAERALKELASLDTSVGATPNELRLKLQEREAKQIRDSSVPQTLEKIRNRVDQFGVTEPLIVPEGDRRIVVQLPGLKDPQRVIDLIGKTALLELKVVDTTLNPVQVEQGKVSLPPDLQLLYMREVGEKKEIVVKRPIVVQRRPVITGASLIDARVQVDDKGGWLVAFALDREGGRIFAEFTGANIGRQLAIVLDDTVYSAPVIRSKISEGRGVIEGNFTPESARDLALILREGALPASVKIVSNLNVGPSLGQDSIRAGVQASIVAGIVVILFMGVYYRWSGVIADLALLLNLLMMLAVLAGIQATLTLPGIAGIALTIGMAVDSNVLIFERIREELRLGKTVRSAIDSGFGKAWVAILDSHVTTLITALALFLFGSGPVRGFAVT
ncbi:MAG: protein translocase subunit SecD, partial [candidate division NC10 bacterium]|nr:protein translocase subunit SecD [candidate division NC10 bacterium]